MEVTNELPTREEVIETTREAGMLAYDGAGKRVGRGENGALHCRICDGASGEVTLVRVEAFGGLEKGYVCFGGNCALQRNKAIVRMFKAVSGGPKQRIRLTDKGRTMQWQLDEDGNSVKVYARTSRAHAKAKVSRKQQAASKRANRGR